MVLFILNNCNKYSSFSEVVSNNSLQSSHDIGLIFACQFVIAYCNVVFGTIKTPKGFYLRQKSSYFSTTLSVLNLGSDIFGVYQTVKTLLHQALVFDVIFLLWLYGKYSGYFLGWVFVP